MIGIGLLTRAILVVLGRTSVIDGFYLQGAWLLGEGRTPYVDFTLVAFPGIETLYASVFAVSRSMAAASLLSGLAVIGTGVILTRIARDRYKTPLPWLAGVLYVTAAPIIAFHGFERELWSALFLSAAYLTVLHPKPTDLRAGAIGLLISAAMTAKLTAGVGAVVIAADLIWRRKPRVALIAAGAAVLSLSAVAMLLRARYGDSFSHQVLFFFFFKGEAATFATRASVFARHIDPNLALGLLATVWILARPGKRPGRIAAITLVGYGVFYAVSPSLWDHNLIDFAWPAALAGSALIASMSRPSAAILLGVALIVGARGAGSDRPGWFPHGFGGPDTEAVGAQVQFLLDHSGPDDVVIAPTPLSCTLAGRESLSFDPELEPVALGLAEEMRRHGTRRTWARRKDGVLLGAPPGVPEPAKHGALFSARRDAAALFHVLPRLIDAILAREPAVVITPMPPAVIEALVSAGYHFEHREGVQGYYRR